MNIHETTISSGFYSTESDIFFGIILPSSWNKMTEVGEKVSRMLRSTKLQRNSNVGKKSSGYKLRRQVQSNLSKACMQLSMDLY